jgi:hypothetical protein
MQGMLNGNNAVFKDYLNGILSWYKHELGHLKWKNLGDN